MSNQVFANSDTPYWLSSFGVDDISFNKLAAPPLAFLDKGVLYELNDGKLYFNGVSISDGTAGNVGGPASSTNNAVARFDAATGKLIKNSTVLVADAGDVSGVNSLTVVPTAANPGGANTLWKDSVSGSFMAGASALGTVSGPVSSVAGEVPVFIDASGGVLGQSGLLASTNALKSDLILSSAAPSGYGVFGAENTVIGHLAGNIGGSLDYTGCTYVGARAGRFGNASYNVAIGSAALSSNLSLTGSTVAIGPYALSDGTATMLSVGIGESAGMHVAGATRDVYIGQRSGFGHAATSADNVILGALAVGATPTVATTGLTNNVIIGSQAAYTTAITGAIANNVIIGYDAGRDMTTSANCVYIANHGAAADTGAIRIGTLGTHLKVFAQGIRGITTGNADAIPVLVDSLGQLGTVSSSIRYKENVESLADSEVIYKLRPVKFNYKSQPGHKSIGLIAEEVEAVYPEMCIYHDVDENRELLTVDYPRLSTLLLAEVQKLRKALVNAGLL